MNLKQGLDGVWSGRQSIDLMGIGKKGVSFSLRFISEWWTGLVLSIKSK